MAKKAGLNSSCYTKVECGEAKYKVDEVEI
jgi:hypothetical protein